MREVYFNRKAQALVEVAIFGAILLMVLSALIRYGITYNQRQSLNMRAFRKSLSESINTNRPDAQATVYLVEDKHVPDVGDMFGVGDIDTVEASASVVWGNTLQEEYADIDDLPNIKYIVNNEEKEYTTAAYGGDSENICSKKTGKFFIKIEGVDDPIEVENPELKFYDREDVYYPERGDAMFEWFDDLHRVVGIWEVGKNTKTILYAEKDPDDPNKVGCLAWIDHGEGEINPDFFEVNADIDDDGTIDVDITNKQGLLIPKQTVIRKDSLNLKDSNTSRESTTIGGTTITVEHKIKLNKGGEDVFEPYEYIDDEKKVWPAVTK